jgi:hypothetical protein
MLRRISQVDIAASDFDVSFIHKLAQIRMCIFQIDIFAPSSFAKRSDKVVCHPANRRQAQAQQAGCFRP